MKKTFKIYTLGCKVNQYESSLLKTAFIAIGLKETKEEADFVIINTCSVTKSAISKDGRAVSRARKENPRAKIYLMGCLVRIDENKSKSLAPDKLSQNVDPIKILKDFGLEQLLQENIKKIENFADFDRARYFVKIQDGCEQFCSYCIIPYVRGKMKSRREKDVLEEIKRALKMGYREIVLSGIHIGLYGKERGNMENQSLSGLLGKIIIINGEFRVRISSIEITEISNELIELLKNSDKICKHLHISLQSGSDKILKAMNRPYSKEYFRKRIEKIRKEVPGIAISTDIIVGFPGETGKDFQDTFEFAQKIAFSKIHVFSFSAHKITKAYSMENQVSKETIKKRSSELRKLSLSLEKEFKNSKKGEMVAGIVQNVGKDDKVKIISEYHFDFVRDIDEFKKIPKKGEYVVIRY